MVIKVKEIILLGGAPAIGKSTVGGKLSKAIKIPCISTDDIRTGMRETESKIDSPALFYFEKSMIGEPADFLRKISLMSLIRAVDKESKEVWRGIEKTIFKKDNDKKSIIIEGVAVLPKEAAAIMKCNNNIKAFILVNSNSKFIEDTINNRGLGGKPNLFPEELKQKQIKWVKKSNKIYKERAQINGLDIIDVNDHDHISKIIKLINS